MADVYRIHRSQRRGHDNRHSVGVHDHPSTLTHSIVHVTESKCIPSKKVRPDVQLVISQIESYVHEIRVVLNVGNSERRP